MTLESEQLLLASCLSGAKDWLRLAVARGVEPAHFAEPSHRAIWSAILDADGGDRVRYADVHATLLRKAPEAAMTCDVLYASGRSHQSEAYHVEEILRGAVATETRAVLADVSRGVEHWRSLDGAQASLREASSRLDALAAGLKLGERDNSFLPVYERTLEDLARLYRQKQDGAAPWLTTGVPRLDQALGGGFQRPGVYVVCAMSGRGKTHLGIHFALEAARAGAAVVYFTVEMPQVQIMRRVIANSAAVKSSQITSLALTDAEMDRIEAVAAREGALRLAIEDNFKAELGRVAGLIRRYKRAGRLDMAVVDYVQQLVPSGRYQTKQQELWAISHELKQLAIEHDVVMLQLAQTNRKAEEAEAAGERLNAGHIEHSHAIYEHADAVVFFQVHVDVVGRREDLLYVAKNRHAQSYVAVPVELDYEHSRLKPHGGAP